MARVCQLTGKKPRVGNNVSHSNNKTKRRFDINLKTKKFFLVEENRWITLRVATSTIRDISKNGLAATLKKAEEKGFYASK
jgi:large subunit ribosomal protein L28